MRISRTAAAISGLGMAKKPRAERVTYRTASGVKRPTCTAIWPRSTAPITPSDVAMALGVWMRAMRMSSIPSSPKTNWRKSGTSAGFLGPMNSKPLGRRSWLRAAATQRGVPTHPSTSAA